MLVTNLVVICNMPSLKAFVPDALIDIELPFTSNSKLDFSAIVLLLLDEFSNLRLLSFSSRSSLLLEA